MKTFKEYLEEGSKTELHAWVTPFQEWVDVTFGDHFEYVKQNPKKFNMGSDDIRTSDGIWDNIFKKGAVKITIWKRPDHPHLPTSLMIDGMPEAIKNGISPIHKAMKDYDVDEVMWGIYNDEGEEESSKTMTSRDFLRMARQ